MQLAGAGIVLMHVWVDLTLDRVKHNTFEDLLILSCENFGKASTSDR